jgi:glutaminyl-tRNA synthetase
MSENNEAEIKTNFIYTMIKDDLEQGRLKESPIHTRFPPEPNGYLHIGHAKAILLNYGIAKDFKGLFNLRFDDTNPIKEEQEFVDSIIEDIRWLGADWGERQFFSSDYFETKYTFALRLIEAGQAYVCDLSPEEIRAYRGTLTEPGRPSPYRERPAAENLDLFERMRRGEFPNGSRVLRAKIDMTSGNLNMRDPVIYRILHATHHRTGDQWCIYPMYDFDHPFSDALEGITHSLCSIEYSDHRPLYDWIVDKAVELVPDVIKFRSRQTEFSRLNLTYTVMSKRKLRRLVEENFVSGWDDPRMPTIAGLRRRGVTPEAIADFQNRVGVSRSDSTADLAFLEHCIRNNLETRAPRLMAVLEPLKVVITNWPADKTELLEMENLPGDEQAGNRQVPFCGEIYVEREDFMEDPPKKFFRLTPGKEVRLKGAYIICCDEVIKDSDGKVIELRCTYDPQTKSNFDTSGKKVKGVIHWVSAKHATRITVNLYDTLFTVENPEEDSESDFTSHINRQSLVICEDVPAEPAVSEAAPGSRFQFLRKGYFYLDPESSKAGTPVFNRIVALRDSWAKIKEI